MASGPYRRHQGGGLEEPLLGRHSDEDVPSTSDVAQSERERVRKKLMESKAWHENVISLISQWAQWFINVAYGSSMLLGGAGGLLLRMVLPPILGGPPPLPPLQLTGIQEERLRKLQARVSVPYDAKRPEHQAALQQLWEVAYPAIDYPGTPSVLWKEMGWQGEDPATDFRGGGFVSLENLIFFARTYPGSFQRLLRKEEGPRSAWEYPFAVAGINVTFMLVQLLDLKADIPKTTAGRTFVGLLEEDDAAFDKLFCMTLEMLDVQWLAMRASYMEFNVVMKATKEQVEEELKKLASRNIEDMPQFALLQR